MSRENTIIECLYDISVDFKSTENIIPIISENRDFNDIKKLPINQIPEIIRKSDPNLRSQPLYEIKSKNSQSSILLGDYMIGIKTSNYTKWKDFFEEGKNILQNVFSRQEVDEIKRIGLRYINFFKEEDIFKTGKISLKIADKSIESNNRDLHITMKESIKEKIVCVINIANNYNDNAIAEVGSIVDIIVANENNNIYKNEVFNKIDELHNFHKRKLKEIVSEEYANRYNL